MFQVWLGPGYKLSCFVLFFDPGCPGTCFVDQTGLELKRSSYLRLLSAEIKGIQHYTSYGCVFLINVPSPHMTLACIKLT